MRDVTEGWNGWQEAGSEEEKRNDSKRDDVFKGMLYDEYYLSY